MTRKMIRIMLTQSKQNMQPKILIHPSDKKTNTMNQTPL